MALYTPTSFSLTAFCIIYTASNTRNIHLVADSGK